MMAEGILEKLTELFLLNATTQRAAVRVCIFCTYKCAMRARVHNFLGVTAWMFCQMSASQP